MANPAEAVLQDELAQANRALNRVGPVLSHLLLAGDQSLVSDAVVAHIRAMLRSIATDIIAAVPNNEAADGGVTAFADQLAGDAPLVTWLHSVAVEGQLNDILEAKAAIDPVLSPLWQELVASSQPETSELAMKALAAQARFVQGHRRMRFRVNELPPETLERVLRLWARAMPLSDEPTVTAAIHAIKSDYDEAETRIGLITRLVSTIGHGAIAALELDHGGIALFASAWAQQSGQSRVQAVLACHDTQTVRLALGLRAAGLNREALERQCALLGPSVQVSYEMGELSPKDAKALLSASPISAFAVGTP